MARARRPTAVVALALCLLAGCTAANDAAGTAAPVRTAGVAAAPDAGPAPPPSPPAIVQAAVDLSAAVPGVPVTGSAAVGTPDGGAYVLLTSTDLGRPAYLATVGGEHAVTGTMPITRLRPVWGMHALGDGTVLVAGQFSGPEAGFGFLVADPATGRTRTSVLIPFEEGTDLAQGESAVSADGTTVHLLLRSFEDGRQLNLLVAADVATGAVHAGRDLFLEVREVSRAGLGPYTAWLFARPDGGVGLVFDAYPAEAGIHGVPTLLRYDAVLEPEGPAVAMTELSDRAQLQAATATADGTVYVSAEVDDGTWVLTVPPGASTATRMTTLPGRDYGDALVVGPTRDWAALTTERGARTVNLATAGTAPLELGCPAPPDVTVLEPGPGGVGALVVGRCENRPPSPPTLWLTRPAD